MKSVLAALAIVTWLLISFSGVRADGGVLTLPLDSTSINSWYDHHYPGPFDDSDYLPFIRWDGYSDPTSNALVANCTLTFNCYSGHEGVDFVASAGTGVIASARGVVVQDNLPEPFGTAVRIWHSQLGISTVYTHLNSASVNLGQTVYRGQLVGLSGCTGSACDGDHLHFGVLNSQDGETTVDPHGWAFVQPPAMDPYGSNIGHLWGTRLGIFSGSSINAKEGQLNAGWESNLGLPGSGSVTAMSMDGSRVGIVRGGTAYAKDASLNVNQPNGGWQLIRYNATDIKLSGNRLGVRTSGGVLVMKEGALNSGWLPDDVAVQVIKFVLTPTRIGVRTTASEFNMKDHGPITGAWHTMLAANQARDIALSDEWIGAATFGPCVNCLLAKDTLNGTWLELDNTGGVFTVTMGGKGLDRRVGTVKNGVGIAKEEILAGAWVTLGPAVEIALNSGRAARRTASPSCQIYANQTEILSPVGGSLIATACSGVRLN